MPSRRLPPTLLALILATSLSACVGDADPAPDAPGTGVTAFVGATIWDGTGAPPIRDAVLLVHNGRIMADAPSSRVRVPTGATVHDLSGYWIIPGLINAHGHVGQARGLESGASAHTRENILEQLLLSARYGVTTVVSLGEPGYEGVAVRDEQDHSGLDRARLFVAGVVMDPHTPEEAAGQVAERAAAGVDWAKIRVDDGLGQGEAMSPDAYRATIEAASTAGLPLTAHVVYLEDAKGLIRAGAEVLGHSVRDLPVDEELIALMRESGSCLHPTLTREVSTFVYASRPDFFDDPFFLRSADPDVLAALETPAVQARYTGRAADWYRAQLPTAAANMVALHEAGVPIAFGTDSGPAARFQGYFEHMELQMMQDAGMSAEAALLSATSVAADCMRLEGVGRLIPGAWADFLVLRADPLADVRNLREIEDVRVAGNPVRDARFGGGDEGTP